MPAKVEITLAESDKKKLEKNLRNLKTSIRLKERSQIILLAAKRLPNYIIGRQLGLDINTVGRWRNRYAAEGYTGTEKERPRGANHGGKNSAKQARLRSLIIKKTTQEKPKNTAYWSVRSLAREIGTTHSFVGRVQKGVGLKPYLDKQFKVSNDPLFEEKLDDVVGLYLNPPERAIVFCADEKSSVPALNGTQHRLPIKSGRWGTVTHDYKNHGTSRLFAALNVETGKVIGECKSQHQQQEFLAFLETVEKQVAKEFDLHLIVDNYATHKRERIRNWLKCNPRIYLHFIPTSSSWLNLVERFFGLISEKQIRRGALSSVAARERVIADYIEKHNADKKPSVRAQSAPEVLEKVGCAKAILSIQ